MGIPGDKNENKMADSAREDRIREKLPNGNRSEKSEIEQTRIEDRREADLEDKSPAGDAGVEDNTEGRQADDPIGESNY
jgi:hypothetical protein